MNEDSNIPNKVLSNNLYSLPINNVHFKILVPSISVGAIIGKSGESINQMQKETYTKVKISKSNDFYPGTKERVCLIIGTVDGIIAMHTYIMDRINDKLDRNMLQQHNHGMIELTDRQRQVKILVPNSTAGLIIGKSGAFIKDIKETTGAFVQISQKAKEINLLERCIIIAGEFEHIKSAIKIILIKLSQDPQSKMYPNISYVDICGPVASAFPTGSPYAEKSALIGKKEQELPVHLLNVQIPYNSLYFNINNSVQSALSFGNNDKLLSSLCMPSEISSLSANCSQFNRNLEQNSMRIMLKRLGYSNNTSDEIMSALMVLDKYGLLGKSYSSQANYLNVNSNCWMPNNKPCEPNQLNKFAVNYPCFRKPNFNNVFYMPSVNEMSKNINFCQIQPTNYKTIIPPSSMVSHFSPLPMSLQITPMASPSILSVYSYQTEIINCALSQKDVMDIEMNYHVKIHIKKQMNIRNDETNTERRLLTIIGNEQNINNVLHFFQRDSVISGTESQIIINNYQSPGDLDAIDNSD